MEKKESTVESENLLLRLRGKRIAIIEPCSQPWLEGKDMDNFEDWKEVIGKKVEWTFFDGTKEYVDLKMIQEIFKNENFGVIIIDSHGNKESGIRLSLVDQSNKPPKNEIEGYHRLNTKEIAQLNAKNTVVITLGCETAEFAHDWISSGTLAVIAPLGSPFGDEIYRIAALIIHYWMVDRMEISQAVKMAQILFKGGKYDCFEVFFQ